VVANGCATATGLYDPLAEMASFCRAHGLWLHVDGAHGASALLHPATRPLLAGIEHADSLVWDAHKMLKTSVLCAAVLYRGANTARTAFSQHPEYMPEEVDDDHPNVFERQAECTKTGLGLKLFLVLATHGTEALGELVHALYRRAAEFHARIEARPGFSAFCAPQSNILCFRHGEDDDLQEWVRQSLVEEGSFYLSSTFLGGRRWLRVVLMNELTGTEHLDALLDRIETCARAYPG
jgi:L-2,4-diaminobutyrate decarboxylase